jgi:hypothetical protein
MTIYKPESRSSREALAIAILTEMRNCGFSLEQRDHTDEAVYSREVNGTDGKIKVMVYTTVVAGAVPTVRTCGKDAIRVCAVYRSERTGTERGIIKETRTHRTGKIEDIVERMVKRMRSVYGDARTPHCCGKCGAPTFTSKNDNQVCADLCWKSVEEIQRDDARRKSRFAAKRERASYWSRRRRRR